MFNKKQDQIIEEKYIICIDGIPQYYISNYDNAIEEMWNLARKLQFENHSYNSFIHIPITGFPNAIHIIGKNMLFIIPYNKVLYRLQVDKIITYPVLTN